VNPRGRIVGVPVQAGATFGVGNPVEVTADGPLSSSNIGALGRSYDISPDDKRFLVILNAARADEARPPQLNVVLNWSEELKRLVSAKR